MAELGLCCYDNTEEGMVGPREDSKTYFKKKGDLGSSMQEIRVL